MTDLTSDIPPWFPLETPRLRLRPFRREDHDAIHAYGSDPEVSRYMEWGPNTLEDTAEFLDRQLAAQIEGSRTDASLAVELKETEAVIGAIRLWVVDEANGTAEIGYSLGRTSWRKGLATEAARAMLSAGFGRLGLHRVVATCDVRNVGSWGVMEKLGMRREGAFLQDRMIKGAWRDTYLYAVLAEDYWAGAGAGASAAS